MCVGEGCTYMCEGGVGDGESEEWLMCTFFSCFLVNLRQNPISVIFTTSGVQIFRLA